MFGTTNVDSGSVTSNAFSCSVCGSLVWIGGYHACGGTPSYTVTQPPLSPACHCWCGDATVNGKPHKTCCMCFGRRLKAAHE
jgi:hypothetical protein